VPGGTPPTTTPLTISLGVLIEEIKAQLSWAKAVRKVVAIVEKSGFFATGMPVSQAWKQ